MKISDLYTREEEELAQAIRALSEIIRVLTSDLPNAGSITLVSEQIRILIDEKGFDEDALLKQIKANLPMLRGGK